MCAYKSTYYLAEMNNINKKSSRPHVKKGQVDALKKLLEASKAGDATAAGAALTC